MTARRQAHPRKQRREMALAWVPPGDMDQARWAAAGHRLGELGRVSNWWIGDWLRYGAAKFGEKYTLAAKITGYDRHSLENMVYVASHYELSLRRENVSWSHHFLVAALPAEERDKWLRLAAEQRLSVNDLRIEVKAAQRAIDATERPDDVPATPAVAPTVVCPQCGCEVALRPPTAAKIDEADGALQVAAASS
jgi:hypothetical protein